MERQADELFMRAAICEAAKGDAVRTAPNPRVGAVIVEDGAIVARGHFQKDGGPHAERWALQDLARPPSPEATLYVTMEPCSTKGRTGACTEAILAAGLRRVVVGVVDPTPEHGGRGVELLRAAGIEVIDGVLESECAALNPQYRGHSSGG